MRRFIILAGLLGMLASGCSGGSAKASPYPPCTPHGFTSPGEALPACTFQGFNGEGVVRLASLRGKPTVINFWASWCIHCIGEMPSFQRVYAELRGRVAFVGMNVVGLQGETEGAGRAFARRTGVAYQLAFDPGGLLYAHFYATTARPILPITVFVDAHGIVRERHFGPLDAKGLASAIRSYFGIA